MGVEYKVFYFIQYLVTTAFDNFLHLLCKLICNAVQVQVMSCFLTVTANNFLVFILSCLRKKQRFFNISLQKEPRKRVARRRGIGVEPKSLHPRQSLALDIVISLHYDVLRLQS